MNQPSNFNFQTTYNPETNQYLIQQRLGEYNLGIPKVLTFEEFQKYNFDKSISDYWNKKIKR